jgi:DNA polymerase-3 subunit epsilon
MILAFDVETTGLPVKGQPPEHPGQPHIVQLAAILLEDSGRERASVCLIVKPDGYVISDKVSAIHGIDMGIAKTCGVPLVVAMGMFSNMCKLAATHIAHNAEYDELCILAAFHRVKRPCPPLNIRCTKDMSSPLLNLPPTEKMKAAGFGNKPKAPSLAECVRFFFNEEIDGAHDALVDTKCCARIYLEMLKRAA